MSSTPSLPPPDDDAPWKSLRFKRDRLRSEIRTRMNRGLAEHTGIQDAQMPWTESGFIDHMVFEHHCGVEGWPRSVPFKNLSSILGGCAPLEEILDALVSGTLRIVKLTDEQLAEARVNPESFLPNPTLRSEPAKPRKRETYHVVPLVLHPLDLRPISHPHASEPLSDVDDSGPAGSAELSASSVASPLIRIAPGPETVPRRQRRDIKKRRRRPVTNPDDRPPRRRRLGVQTPEYVYDAVPGSTTAGEEREDTYSVPLGSAPSDDYVECFTERLGGTASEAESEIESATESWACGSRSEIEDFTSDED
ncbi:hypothetical protein GSI_11212 [Ganoderma sinense ZZ0214-1]|uniref:Uncharacterized protein n=1 Tax=Ganoderma sinense ZZ0214-1 TaxID=1077348 RepID=A0A2G8RYV3_9APHY|nr:hypothetical protein GSI_11212 [Ganoderma sinense ZZ0214-1]